jgi:uncharacterized cupin superfamily protein
MRKARTCLVLFSASIAVTAFYRSRSASATPPKGYRSSSLAVGRFSEIGVVSSFPPALMTQRNEQLPRTLQEAKGSSDVYVQSNVWEPGGSTGWHSHPGDSLIIVTEGTVTDYDGHDPACKPHVYTKGMGFVDPGGGHIHILRNEGDVEAKTIAVQLLPVDAARRIDVPDPGNCRF